MEKKRLDQQQPFIQQGRILSVNISLRKGVPKEPRDEVVLDTHGIVGDAHAGPGNRQISLLSRESIDRFRHEHDLDISWGRFAENITTEAIDLSQLNLLDTLVIDETVLEVTQIGKQCHGTGCSIFQTVGRCVMPTEGIFCRVRQGGRIQPASPITHVRRCLPVWVITLSDRVSQGVYADATGPWIQERLHAFWESRGWNLAIQAEGIADDPALLSNLLQKAKKENPALLITTGGTGVGPRDCTPDVVLAMADKTIPGIMEWIRLKYGATFPNALLSRSVAAVMGSTLVLTLPGSQKAVHEYMEELEKVFEHLVFLLQGIEMH
ncbi:MAG: molybdopterin-binding protein [bacterium]|jgi:molybdenum cofactor synthesis domain-containing protein|nr:molybdopterin-binding protein [bacterium]